MKKRSLIVMSVLVLIIGIGAGCGKGWEMDYGKPAAQFLQKDVASKGKEYVGKKITIKGVVSRTDFTDPDAPLVFLEGGIKCNFGDMKAMAQDCKVGDTVFIDGFLKKCEKGDIVIDPASERDPKAAFSPK